MLGLRQWSSAGFAMPPPPGQWVAQVSTALRSGVANADAATESSLTQPQVSCSSAAAAITALTHDVAAMRGQCPAFESCTR